MGRSSDSVAVSHTFRIDAGRALLQLEAAGLLSEPVSEFSPLRRLPTACDSTQPFLPVLWDSRAVAEHEADGPCLFVARHGARFDGHTLAEAYLAKGHIFVGEPARIVAGLAGKRPQSWIEELLVHPALIKVTNAEAALSLLLEKSSHLDPRSFKTIAITGTNGKTSTTQIAGNLLAALVPQRVLRIGTLGLQLGSISTAGAYPTMPDYSGLLTALNFAREHDCRHVVMEATSIGLVEGRLGNWRADVGVFTNLTQDHLDYHETLERYLDAKLLLFRKYLRPGGTIVVNAEDACWEAVVASGAGDDRKVIGFGNETAQKRFFSSKRVARMDARFLCAADRLTDVNGLKGTWRLSGVGRLLGEQPYTCPLLGDFQHENLLAAVGALIALNISLERAAHAALLLQPIPGRLELVSVPDLPEQCGTTRLPTVIVDYAHSPDALEKALSVCRALIPSDGRLVCVFGCGGDRDPGKRPQMGRIAAERADVVIVTSDNPRTEHPDDIIDDIVEGIPHDRFARIVDRRDAIHRAVAACRADDLVVIAGKGHEDYQIIGTETLPFSDVRVAREALVRRATAAKQPRE